MWKICVLMSVYNGEKYILEQIKSIINQANVEIKLIIRNDSSTDHTMRVIETIYSEYPDSIEIVNDGMHVGFSKSYLKLLKFAHAKYFEWADYYAFSDQDDVWITNKIQEACNRFESDTEIELYGSSKTVVDEKLNFIRVERIITKRGFWDCFSQLNFSGCTMVMSKDFCNLLNSYDLENVNTPYHDAFILRMALCLGKKVFYDNESYILYRQHNDNAVGTIYKESILEFISKVGRLKHNNHYFKSYIKEIFYGYKDYVTEENLKYMKLSMTYDKSWIKKKAFLSLFLKNSSGNKKEKFIFSMRIIFNRI